MRERARSVADSELRDWVSGCLTDLAGLDADTRETLARVVMPEGGVSTPERGSFFHCRCRFLQAEIRFRTSPSEPFFGTADPVREVERVVLDLQQAD